MRERVAQILKIVCLGLAALLLVQLVKAGFRANPLVGVTIPEVPSLPADTNAPPALANKAPGKPSTNPPVTAATSNAPGAAVNTNAIANRKSKPDDTNPVPVSIAAAAGGTNTTNTVQTNLPVAAAAETNVTSPAKAKVAETNSAPAEIIASSPATNSRPTNISASVSVDTNIAIAKVAAGTNAVATNSVIVKASRAKKPPAMPPEMMGGPMMMGGPAAKAAKLSPEIQARVDRVVESEILGPINHPMPMALLGIAGNVAFLRSPSGQTGMVKEGEDLGEIKLLRIGINRVLVEQDGQPKELMIFSGLGGESLVSKSTVTSDESTKH